MDLLDRLYFRLRDALASAPLRAPSTGPTVADVYQRLVPYRAVRGDLGILELAEYEHALMRLLAGERGYAAIDSEDARAELERELASPNPILGVYRDYSALPVRLRAAANGVGPGADAGDPALAPAAASSAARGSAGDAAAAGDDAALGNTELSGPAGPTSRAGSVCARCGARLRDEWRFCTRCGAPREGVPPRA